MRRTDPEAKNRVLAEARRVSAELRGPAKPLPKPNTLSDYLAEASAPVGLSAEALAAAGFLTEREEQFLRECLR